MPKLKAKIVHDTKIGVFYQSESETASNIPKTRVRPCSKDVPRGCIGPTRHSPDRTLGKATAKRSNLSAFQSAHQAWERAARAALWTPTRTR